MILYRGLRVYTFLARTFSTKKAEKSTGIMKVLNVAEKNDAAKNIAAYLSGGTSRRREGYCVFNKIYDFNYTLWGQVCEMRMTSVSGHLLNHEFESNRRQWESCEPVVLFDAPVQKICPTENQRNLKKTLEREVRGCSALIIWTDCDREGENIAFEVINVCKAVKPNIKIHRAKFSEITSTSVKRAIMNLTVPNKAVSDAVEVRSELDLRIGAAFTRFQSRFLRKVFPQTLAGLIISYGSCQFPTLGFIVERYLAIEAFVSEPYWKLKVQDVRDNLSADFVWGRQRLFEKAPCQALLEECLDNPEATVKKVISKPKSKFRPMPLDTVEMQKQCARKLRITAKEVMNIAEKLYNQGFISYPRTETNIFPKELDLRPLVGQQVPDSRWGDFAHNLMRVGLHPRQGKKTDEAHPPIHPTKYTNTLQGNSARVYEYIVRHFLACLSSNAEGQETSVEIELAGEKFTAKGLHVIAKNYLEVYIYERWSEKEMPIYREGQVFRPTDIEMAEESTSPPQLLTEADLIALMDKHGIGTDATHAEHIDTVKKRFYADLNQTNHLMPGKLGIGLVMGYDKLGFQMSKPHLRAELERDLKLICEEKKNPSDVLRAQIAKYRHVYQQATEKATVISESLATYLDEAPTSLEVHHFPVVEKPVYECPKCAAKMSVKFISGKKVIGCMAFPGCKNAIWFPRWVENIEVLNEMCNRCTFPIHKLKFTLNSSLALEYGRTYETCVGGCDPRFNNDVGVQTDAIPRPQRAQNPEVARLREIANDQERNVEDASQQPWQTSGGGPLDPIVIDSEISEADLPYRLGRGDRSRNVPRSPGLAPMEPPPKRRYITPNPAVSRRVIPKDTQSNSPKPTWGNVDDNEELMCHCHERAVKLTVRKENANKGRQFFKCARPAENACNFFTWATDEPSQSNASTSTTTSSPPFNNSMPSTSRTNSSNGTHNSNRPVTNRDSGYGGSLNNPSSSEDSVQMCNCNKPAIRKKVMKESANKGREFYACWSGMARECNFFQWVDEVGAQPPRFKPATKNASQAKGAGGQTRAKRKCGICGTEGHTRKTCRQNAMD